MFKRLYDITWPLDANTPVYPGDPAVRFDPLAVIGKDKVNMLSLSSLSTHSGTHIDAPLHFITGGKSIDQYAPDDFILPAQVVHVEGPCIDRETLERCAIQPVPAVLLKTRNSSVDRVDPDSAAYLSKSGAEFLVERKVRLVGIDYVTIEKISDNTFPAHYALLGSGILIVESLLLKAIEPGLYTLICLPLKIARGDGAPVRALLGVE